VAKNKRERRVSEQAQLEMTPMIDVVFQLLIFFLVTVKQRDILANLNVSRPAPDSRPPPEKQIDELLTIQVYNERTLGGEGYVLKGRQVSLRELDRQLSRIAQHSANVSIIVKCTGDSSHSNLVRLLDVCAKSKLTNIAVFSM
jgi:biopolymer transport protein ExbD